MNRLSTRVLIMCFLSLTFMRCGDGDELDSSSTPTTPGKPGTPAPKKDVEDPSNPKPHPVTSDLGAHPTVELFKTYGIEIEFGYYSYFSDEDWRLKGLETLKDCASEFKARAKNYGTIHLNSGTSGKLLYSKNPSAPSFVLSLDGGIEASELRDYLKVNDSRIEIQAEMEPSWLDFGSYESPRTLSMRVQWVRTHLARLKKIKDYGFRLALVNRFEFESHWNQISLNTDASASETDSFLREIEPAITFIVGIRPVKFYNNASLDKSESMIIIEKLQPYTTQIQKASNVIEKLEVQSMFSSNGTEFFVNDKKLSVSPRIDKDKLPLYISFLETESAIADLGITLEIEDQNSFQGIIYKEVLTVLTAILPDLKKSQKVKKISGGFKTLRLENGVLHLPYKEKPENVRPLL